MREQQVSASKEERLPRFMEIVKRGGSVVMAPDVGALLSQWSVATGTSLAGVEIRVSEWVPPGTMVAIARTAR